MNLPTLNIFRHIGLAACAIMLGLGLAGMADWGPQQLQNEAAQKKAMAMLAQQLARIFASTAAQRATFGYGIFLTLFVLALSLFAIAFWLRTSPHRKCSAPSDVSLLAAQLLIGVLAEPWTEPGLIYLFAAELAFVLPQRAALAWLCVQIVLVEASAIPLLLSVSDGNRACNVAGVLPPPFAVMTGLDWIRGIAFQIFSFCIGYFASTEMRDRMTLDNAHADLLATQRLLADVIRTAERERVARDLHDAIGHHLIALKLQLDLAMRQVGGHIIESVQTSRELAQHLLAEVRAVVSIEREHQPIDLRQALETLCAGIPSPRIALSFDAALALNSPSLAHTIFRSVQEAISNAVRHSGASVLQIGLSSVSDGLMLSIRDNGSGMHAIKTGNGLRGIRERIEQHGGKLDIANRAEGGFSLQIWLPQSGGVS